MARVDLHVHTSASFDCRVPAPVVVRELRRLGFGPIFLTDHDTTEAAAELAGEAPGEVVIGQEVTTTAGELIGLFLRDTIPASISPEEAVWAIKRQGGLVYLPHPYDRRRRALEESSVERLAAWIDVVEVFNGRAGPDANRRAEELCEIVQAVPAAGSDAHRLADLGSVYVEVERFSGAADFKEKLRRGRIVRRPPRWRLRASAAARVLVGREQ